MLAQHSATSASQDAPTIGPNKVVQVSENGMCKWGRGSNCQDTVVSHWPVA
jgi:hypothetical protein